MHFQFDLSVLRPIMSKTSRHPQSIKFLFAGNPWSCDCENVNEIQEFLYACKSFLHDAEHLTCQGESVSSAKNHTLPFPDFGKKRSHHFDRWRLKDLLSKHSSMYVSFTTLKF